MMRHLTLLLGLGLLLAISGCGREPFPMAKVSGKVTYEDGSVIPVERLCLRFYSQSPPVDAKTHPRPGEALLDQATGAIKAVTTHKYNDGLVRGKHKVTLGVIGAGLAPASLVPPEYGDPNQTPLEIDTAQQPLELKVRKPQ